MKWNRFVRIMFRSVILFSMVLCASCSKYDKVEQQLELTEMNVAYMPNFGSLHDVITGVNRGIFEEEGVKVNLVEFVDGATIIAAMESGSIDIGNIGPGAHRLPIEGRAEIISFSQLGNADEVLGRTDKGVRSLDDLKGKKIGLAAGTSAEAILHLALKEVGLSVNDVELVEMDASSIVSAMLSGSIDAAATWSPNTTVIKRQLGETSITLADNDRYKDAYPAIASYVVKAGYSQKKSEDMKKFLRGLYRSMDYRSEHMAEVVTWVAQKVGADSDATSLEVNDGKWLTSSELLAHLNSGEIEHYYEKQQKNFLSTGLVKSERDVSEYVKLDLMKEILSEISFNR
ncbi:ABC transporter substrate-binding protein [Streptococcus sp. ZJ93]|uniref:ABC transporter substrate-binding protein n=1 Tax=Streptococcus handemini TaxID=3161188 RepID=UPI0032ED82BB